MRLCVNPSLVLMRAGLIGDSISASNVVPGQQSLDVWPRCERWDDVAKDVHVRAEVLEDFLQVLFFFIGTLEISRLLLLGDDEDIHPDAVPHPVKNALAYGLLQPIQAARQVLDFNGDTVLINC